MIHSLRFPFWPVVLAAVLSAAPAHAEGEKFAAAVEAAAPHKPLIDAPISATPVSVSPVNVSPLSASSISAPPKCPASTQLGRLDRPLAHTARLVAAGLPIKIVAVGSSSTAGAGASSPEASYPSRLAIELRERFPGHDITVLNRGVNGEEAQEMLARFQTSVLAEKPDLVLWQLGTNAVLRDQPLPPASSMIEKGVAQLKAAGADIILIDPQFAPKVIAKSALARMLDLLAFKAKQYNVNLFQRFAVMRDWRERQGLAFETFVSPDQLHMNDWSYACVAKVLSASIAEAATRATASASASDELIRPRRARSADPR
jgi:lysophospholipase L1-like esterase